MRMTWRERLADWISGGRLAGYMAATRDLNRQCLNMDVALRDIAAMETPNANATVKRMAKRAREALE